MAVTVYQGTTPTVYIHLTNEDGTTYNASGCVMSFAARQDYASTNYLFNIGATGLNANLSGALTGLFAFPMTTGDTSYCSQNYPAGLTLVDTLSGITKIAIDGGFTILPTV